MHISDFFILVPYTLTVIPSHLRWQYIYCFVVYYTRRRKKALKSNMYAEMRTKDDMKT